MRRSQRKQASPPGRVEQFLELFGSAAPSLIGMEHALAASLTPAELLDALGRSVQQRHARYVILRAIAEHPARAEVARRSKALTLELLRRERKNYQEAQAINGCLKGLFDLVDDPTQAKIIAFWLADRYADSKKRFRLVAQRAGPFGGTDAVFEYWQRNADKSAIKHLVYDSRVEWLEKHFEVLLAKNLEPWLVSRMLLRLAQRDRRVIERVRTSDPITYLYLCAKTKKSLSNADAVALFLASASDTDRRGQALWAIGKLGLWDALQELASQASKIVAADEERFLREYHARRRT